MSTSAITRYFEAFNAGDIDGMLEQMTDDVSHHVNEGTIREGKALFRDYCEQLMRCYQERVLNVVELESPDHMRRAAEYLVRGEYVRTDIGMPKATGQVYVLPGGSFFSFRDGKISRLTTYFNLHELRQQLS